MERPVSSIVNIPKLQPHGGFIPPKDMTVEPLDDEVSNNYEYLVEMSCKMGSLRPQSLGLVFDYLLRTEMALIAGENASDAILNTFKVSFMGASLANKMDDARKLALKLFDLYQKKKRDRKKIAQVASELVVYDAVFRAGYYNPDAEKPKVNDGDKNALDLMLGATECYLLEKEQLTSLGFGFTAIGAENVAPSDGDLLTKDSVIDIKCSVNEPTSKHTLQLLLYYILGLHEQPDAFKPLKYVKILNPRLGRIYSYEIAKVDVESLKHIESEIMGYKKSVFK